MFLPAHCGEHGKITCLKKNKHSNLAFICSIHHDCSSTFHEQYENTTATAVQSWRVTVSITHSNTFPRESWSVITSNILPDKMANCLWSCSIISTATSGRISCCMISSVQGKTEIFNEFIKPQWQFFPPLTTQQPLPTQQNKEDTQRKRAWLNYCLRYYMTIMVKVMILTESPLQPANFIYGLVISERAFHKPAPVDLPELATGLLKLTACSLLLQVPY